MLDTEGRWSEALASNNIRAIIRWLRWFTAEGDVDVEEILPTFSCWVQRTSEFAKKELLTLCFSRCQGLWMFLDRSSFTRVHMLLRRLRNLLTLAEWARRQLTSAHLWHGTHFRTHTANSFSSMVVFGPLLILGPPCRLFSKRAALSAVRQTASGSESEHSISRGTRPTRQEGGDGSEKSPAQDEQQHETHKRTPSSEGLGSGSVSSFTSASSLPRSRHSRPHVYESTSTLRRISSLLADSENQSTGDGDEESSPPSLSVDVSPGRPEPMLTPDGATDLIPLSNLNRAFTVELGLSAEEGEDVFSSEDFIGIDAVSTPFPLDMRINSLRQLCSAGLIPPLRQPQAEGLGVLSPDFGVIDLWSTVLPQEEQSGCIPPRVFSFSEATESDCFVDETLEQKACEHQQEEALGRFPQGVSCSLLTGLHHGPLSEEPVASGKQDSSSALSPVRSLISNSSAPSETTDESPHKARLKTDETFVQSATARLDHCKVGCWWKQDTETCGASSGLLSAAEPAAAFTSGGQRGACRLEFWDGVTRRHTKWKNAIEERETSEEGMKCLRTD
ncbi:hypothetical protein F2P81_003552 [Scophthalmus maximus]|uniref:Uncharacterized protein n=1 Tax=Scophthalmus maximus TaxID=52904 RepID=A0A6A4TMF6_SCOMX|nr:hypothetical protein F2P81_003552 [Scophthalmus maximus]